MKSEYEFGKTNYGAVRENLGRYIPASLLVGNDTVPISVWRGEGTCTGCRSSNTAAAAVSSNRVCFLQQT